MNGTTLFLEAPEYCPSLKIIVGDAENQSAACASALDETSKAAVAFCEAADNADIKDAFDHLMAIAFKAKTNLYLTEPGITSLDATREFLRAWLMEKLLPYRNAGTFHEAARQGAFRYLGRQAKNALIDQLRKRDRSEDALDQRAKLMAIHGTINTDDGGSLSLENQLGVDSDQGLSSAIGGKASLEPSALREEVEEWRDENKKSLGEPLFAVLSTICAVFPDHLGLGDVTTTIAQAHGVSLQTARKLHRKLTNKLCSLKGDPAVRALVRIISRVGDPNFLSTGFRQPKNQTT